MKVLALNGSARAGKGVTARLLAALASGLAQGGAQVRVMEVARLKVAPCLACLKCMLKTPGLCAQHDDMEQIYPALQGADLLVLATPVYTDSMSAQLKAVMDRCICTMQPYLTQGPDGRVRHPAQWSMPGKMLLVSTASFPEPATFAPLVATFRAQAANFFSQPLAELCVPGSIALQMEPHRLEPHLELLSQAGGLLARGGAIPLPLLMAINRPPLSVDEYLEIGRRYEDICRQRLAT
ncbi:MAG: flavodoxin family protein [Desulfarculus sp.]|nr:flavodoxin family protein [Desulfarculus sp.]